LDIAEIFWLVMVPINVTIKQKYKYSN
jgi:hypothetical protein